jgi:hypothetical protein
MLHMVIHGSDGDAALGRIAATVFPGTSGMHTAPILYLMSP